VAGKKKQNKCVLKHPVIKKQPKEMTEAEKKKFKEEEFKKDLEEFDSQVDNYVGIDSETL
jgi:hypothetical protein